MANPDRGEVVLSAGDRAYVLRFGFGALRALEAETGRRLADLDLQAVSMDTLAAFLRAGLRAEHGRLDDPALEAVVDAAGLPATMEALGRALAAAFPPAEDASGNG
jgi:hypothetical protein